MASENNNAAAPAAGEPKHKEKTSLYANRLKAYPRFLNKGAFRRLKWAADIILLAIFWLGPWLRWDRGPGAPDQAILVDLPGRRAYFFFIEIWPQEVYYLTGLLIIAALSLFFISSLLGRVWCGFACWQTVFTDVFVWIERLFQGERNQRMALDKGPWTLGKLGRKAATQAGWIIVSLLFGLGFVLYFENAPSLVGNLISGEAGIVQYVFLGMLSFFCYLLAGFARENVCIYMCPYARFQAAMFDEHSMIVSYEGWRGEPRAPVKGKADFANRGHCVDCKMCVQVCPTGIDIRDGSQLACIGCALCVDACNQVMDRFGLPRGLISYDSSFNQAKRAAGDEHPKAQIFRPRTFVYLGVISLVMGVMIYMLATRSTFELNVLHERAPVYVELSGHRLRNGYTFRILNKERQQKIFKMTVEGVPSATMTVIGIDGEEQKEVRVPVDGDSVGSFRLFVTVPADDIASKAVPLTLVATEEDTGRAVRKDNLFAGPDR